MTAALACLEQPSDDLRRTRKSSPRRARRGKELSTKGLSINGFRQLAPPPCRTDHWRKKLTIVVEDEPRINTKIVGPALLRRRQGMKPPGNAGVPPAQVLAQPRPSPPHGSTDNGARTLLRPSPGCSRRQGGRVPRRRETERYATGVHAGGTPAFPGGPPSSTLAPRGGRRRLAGPQPVPMRQSRHAWRPFVDNSFQPVACSTKQGCFKASRPGRFRSTPRWAGRSLRRWSWRF